MNNAVEIDQQMTCGKACVYKNKQLLYKSSC